MSDNVAQAREGDEEMVNSKTYEIRKETEVCLSVEANDMKSPGLRNNRDRVSIIVVVEFVAKVNITGNEAQSKTEREICC